MVAGVRHVRRQQPDPDDPHPAPGRFEDRTIDGAANPYLAATVILAAGLDGIENKIDPGDPNMGNLYETPTEELARRGIDILPSEPAGRRPQPRQDEVLREALGATPDGDYIDYFCDVKEREWKDYHDRVSDWEVQKYLTLF